MVGNVGNAPTTSTMSIWSTCSNYYFAHLIPLSVHRLTITTERLSWLYSSEQKEYIVFTLPVLHPISSTPYNCSHFFLRMVKRKIEVRIGK